MAVRRKLDLCGVKVSLKQWNHFTLDEREQMVAQDCGNSRARSMATAAMSWA